MEGIINKNNSSLISRIFPITNWIGNYNKKSIRPDVIAGITVWGMIIPEVIAYAALAGLSPQAGIYTAIVGLLIYAVFGTSNRLIVSTTSAATILLAATVYDQNPINSTEYAKLAVGVVVLVGIIFLILALFRLGFITQFISRPVMKGFVSGLAVYIVINQLPKIFGIERINGGTIAQIENIIKNVSAYNYITLLIGGSAIFILILLRNINRKIPGSLITLALGIIAGTIFSLQNFGVKLVGEITAGIPQITLPHLAELNLWVLIPGAIGIVLVSFSESLGQAETLAEKENTEIRPNQELTAFSIANLCSGMLGGMVAGGSMSQSAVNYRAGGKTQLSSISAAILSILTILFLTPIFKNLPEAILASIIIYAVFHFINIKEIRQYYRYEKNEFYLGLTAMLGVIFIGVLQGLVAAIIFSIIWFLYKSISATGSVLGKSPSGPGEYSDIKRHPEDKTFPGVLIYRLNTPLYFANARLVKDNIKKYIDSQKIKVTRFILDMGVNDSIDITSAEELKMLFNELDENNIKIYLSNVHDPVKKIGRDIIGSKYFENNNIFPTIDMAVKSCHKK